MNCVERVRAAINFEEPDSVPIGEFVIDCDIASRVLGRKTFLRDKIATQIAYWEGRRDEVVQGLIRDIPELFLKLDIYDILCVAKLGMVPPKGYRPEAPRKIADGTWEDIAGRIWKASLAANEIAIVHDPTVWERRFTLEQFDLDPEVHPPDESAYEVMDAVLPKLPPGRYLLGDFPMASQQVMLGGWERGLYEIADNPDVVGRAVQASIAGARKAQAMWRDRGCHGVINGTDFGHTTGTFVAPDTCRRLFLPAIKFNVSSAHAQGLDYFQHTCGDSRPIIDQFVEAGVDAMQSLQPEAGMTPATVKKLSGGRIAGWGGVNLHTLISGTPEDVRAEVRQTMETAKRGGGLILGASQSIGFGTKYDNFMAMLDEFCRTRDY